jgi:hypothetical protein
LWTGRLAYADPQWMPASGPAHPARLPEDLVTGPEEVPLVVAAVHQACETLTQLTRTEHEQVRAAAQAGHILVPTRSLPDNVDIHRPFARAPQERVDLLLSGYREAAQASHQAATAVGEIAAATRAPSRALTAARACADPSLGRTDPDYPAGPGSHHDPHDVPGPVERTLLGLGVNRPDLLQRGAAIDRAGERLIIDAAAELEPSHWRPATAALNRSTATVALINHALASGDPRATALLRSPEQREPEQAEPEP